MNQTDAVAPPDLIPIAEAPRYLPSPRPGKKTALSTVYRKVREGVLRCWRQGRWRFVSRSELLALMQPAAVQTPASQRRLAERQRAVDRAESDREMDAFFRAEGLA